MKCIKFKGKIKDTLPQVVRTTDTKAQYLVKQGKASYVPKVVWKETGRNILTDHIESQI